MHKNWIFCICLRLPVDLCQRVDIGLFLISNSLCSLYAHKGVSRQLKLHCSIMIKSIYTVECVDYGRIDGFTYAGMI